jgi:hypothetical protein
MLTVGGMGGSSGPPPGLGGSFAGLNPVSPHAFTGSHGVVSAAAGAAVKPIVAATTAATHSGTPATDHDFSTTGPLQIGGRSNGGPTCTFGLKITPGDGILGARARPVRSQCGLTVAQVNFIGRRWNRYYRTIDVGAEAGHSGLGFQTNRVFDEENAS